MAWFTSLQGIGDVSKVTLSDGDMIRYSTSTRLWELVSGSSIGGVWGSISGTITNQIDLVNYLSANYTPKVMSSLGDMIYGGTLGAATRLPVGNAHTVLQGGSIPNYDYVHEDNFNFSNITTANADSTKHGLLPRLSANAAQYLDGSGNWSSPTAASTNDYSLTTFTGATAVVVLHNFGTYPVVQVILSTGDVEIPYSITHDDENQFTVRFSSATTGSIVASVGSPQPMAFNSVNTNYTVLTSDRIVYANAPDIIITLFTAVGNAGHEIIIDNASGGNITVACYGSQTIEGETTQTLPNNSAMNMYSDGSNWRIY